MITAENRYRLRSAVRFFYDLQKLRIQQGNRSGSDTVILEEDDLEFHEQRSGTLNELEKAELKNVESICKEAAPEIYKWLRSQKGIGPTMAGCILSEVDIHKAETISALWKYCGLHVVDGKAPHPVKGQKLGYNGWLRTKLVGVAATCMIKVGSPWRQYYDNYKNRKLNMKMEVCMGCDGKGKGKKGETKGKKCKNCGGTGKDAPWGESDGHRNRAAIRYMMKMFLSEMWTTWRAIEGLPVTEPYSVAVLGRVHGDHSGMGVHA